MPVEFAGRVGVEDALAAQPGKEALERQEPIGLRGDAERLAVLLAVVEEPALIALEDRAGDFARIEQAALLAPGNEHMQEMVAGLDHGWRVVEHT
jgi:hypothetical protein